MKKINSIRDELSKELGSILLFRKVLFLWFLILYMQHSVVIQPTKQKQTSYKQKNLILESKVNKNSNSFQKSLRKLPKSVQIQAYS